MTDVVKARKWGKADKDKLAGLIEDGTVDIDKPEHLTPTYVNSPMAMAGQWVRR